MGLRNDVTRESLRESKSFFMMPLYDPANADQLDAFYFVDIPQSFVESACFDPRMPSYKRKTIELMFPQLTGKIVQSNLFGYALSQESFGSDLDGHPQ
jgi:hypothetical protein